MWQLTPPLRPSRAVAVAIAAPVIVGTMWALRTPPPAWECSFDPTQREAAALAGWREGAGQAVGLATALLLTTAARLSADRRTAAGRSRRPGVPTVMGCAVLAAVAFPAVVYEPALDHLVDFGLLVALGSPVVALVTLVALFHLPALDGERRATTFAALATWLSLLVTVGGVGGLIATAGGALCWD